MRRVREGASGGMVGSKEEGGGRQVKGKLRFKVGLFIDDYSFV